MSLSHSKKDSIISIPQKESGLTDVTTGLAWFSEVSPNAKSKPSLHSFKPISPSSKNKKTN